MNIWYKLKSVKKKLKALYLSNTNEVADKVNYWRSLFNAQSSIVNASSNMLIVKIESYEQFKKWLAVENYIFAQKSKINSLKKL